VARFARKIMYLSLKLGVFSRVEVCPNFVDKDKCLQQTSRNIMLERVSPFQNSKRGYQTLAVSPSTLRAGLYDCWRGGTLSCTVFLKVFAKSSLILSCSKTRYDDAISERVLRKLLSNPKSSKGSRSVAVEAEGFRPPGQRTSTSGSPQSVLLKEFAVRPQLRTVFWKGAVLFIRRICCNPQARSQLVS